MDYMYIYQWEVQLNCVPHFGINAEHKRFFRESFLITHTKNALCLWLIIKPSVKRHFCTKKNQFCHRLLTIMFSHTKMIFLIKKSNTKLYAIFWRHAISLCEEQTHIKTNQFRSFTIMNKLFSPICEPTSFIDLVFQFNQRLYTNTVHVYY